LQKSGGGVFEISVDGRLAFSKKALGRFPTDQEVRDSLRLPLRDRPQEPLA
jgi:selT/selW/selH-like putative selenoprotein